MGIYIKGMKMPKYCDNCLFTIDDGCMFNNLIDVDTGNAVFDDCPLVEVKEPHGRLIDADELINKHFTKWTCYDTERIGTAPTVIESEE